GVARLVGQQRQGHGLGRATALAGEAVARLVHEEVAHGHGGQAQERVSVGNRGVRRFQPDPGLVHQFGGSQRGSRFAGEALRSQAAKFAIDRLHYARVHAWPPGLCLPCPQPFGQRFGVGAGRHRSPDRPPAAPDEPNPSRIPPDRTTPIHSCTHEGDTMRHPITGLLASVVLAACSASGMPESDVRVAFEQDMPGVLELEDFDLENKRNVGSEEEPVWVSRFTARIAPRVHTFEIDTVVDGVRNLKLVRKAGEDITVYGTVRSVRRSGAWSHTFDAERNFGPALGNPREEDGADALVAGSPEAKALMDEVEATR